MEALKHILRKQPDKLHLLTELLETSVDGTRDIFVNRPLSMAHIRYIGFDMDYTLAIYNKREIEDLAFRLTLIKLVGLKGYPEDILTLPYDVDHVIRGLLIDHRKGNLLKINRFKQVCRVHHGTQPADLSLYFNDRINQSDMQRFASVDTLFSLPEAYLYACMIDRLEAGDLGAKDYTTVFEDIRYCIDLIHRDGSLKSEITRNLARYIYRDPHLPLTLDKFIQSGKRLFLLTNSEWFYTDLVMEYLLETDTLGYQSWRDYFEMVFVSAGKPDFFKGQNPFQVVNPDTHEETPFEGDAFVPGTIYSRGNHLRFEQLSGAQGNEVMYVGDHIYGDVMRSGKDSNWRTVLVVQELEDELGKTEELEERHQRLKRLSNRRDKLLYELHIHSSHLHSLESLKVAISNFSATELQVLHRTEEELQESIRKCQKEIAKTEEKVAALRQELSRSYHPLWGPLFHDGDEISRFGDQVRDYACLYTSRVSNFFFYPTDRYYKSLRDIMPHDRWMELSR